MINAEHYLKKKFRAPSYQYKKYRKTASTPCKHDAINYANFCIDYNISCKTCLRNEQCRNQNAAVPDFTSTISVIDANLMLKRIRGTETKCPKTHFTNKKSVWSLLSFAAEMELQTQHIKFTSLSDKSHKYRIWNNSPEYQFNFKGKQKNIFGYQYCYMLYN